MSPLTKKILKYGGLSSVSATAGAYVGGFLSSPVGHRREGAKEAAATVGVIAGGAVAALAGRRIVGSAARGALKGALPRANVVFRRIRGRIVAMRRK